MRCIVCKSVLLVLLCFIFGGCNTLSFPDDLKEKTKEEKKKKEEKAADIRFTYFAFLKEDNPHLKEDIVCGYLKNTGLLMVPGGELELPCMLKPRFFVENGTLMYNGDEMVSGESEMYCSADMSSQMKIIGTNGKTEYHSVSFVPYTPQPLIELITFDGKDITSKDKWQEGLFILHGAGQYPDIMDTVLVRKRGNGSAKYVKKAFNVRLQKKRSVLGMPKNRKWILLANFCDRTEIRNAVALELGRLADNMEWTPRWQFANVSVNGKLEGLYQIAEQIRVGGNRIDVDEIESQASDITGGYLLELDSYYDRNWKFRTKVNNWPVGIKSPDDEVMTDSMLNYISGFYNGFEECLVDGRFTELYDNYMDIASFIDYGIVQSVTNNGAFFNLYSVFNYKKRNGKLYAGPVWDFDYSTFNNPTQSLFTNGIWYKYLRQDPDFIAQVKERWTQYSKVIDPYIFNFIDSLQTAISKSAHIDETIYPFNEYMPAKKNGDEELTFEEAIRRMKDMFRARIEYMNGKIKDL